jgi:two-component system chemotaxis response regulator CheB
MKKRVLIVDDSASARFALRRLLEGSSTFEVVGEAQNKAEAVELAMSLRPDLVTMDVYLAGDDGLRATQEIMANAPTAVVVVTGLDARRANLAFRATEVGALDVLEKPSSVANEQAEHQRRRFVAALVTLSQIPLLGANRRAVTPLPDPALPFRSAPHRMPLVALGASTGGPSVLFRILKALPAPFPAPIVIVQHIETGFGSSFAEWLSSTGHAVELVTSARRARPGHVFIAPDDAHLRISRNDLLTPVAGAPRGFQRPSIDELFESLALVRGRGTFAALLTGMGEDGAAGLLDLARHGAETAAQAPASCIVASMPEAAIRRGAARFVLDPEGLARALRAFVGRTPTPIQGAEA